jgi:molybdopterin-containing oxidoreductase family membrane subunit
MTSQEQPHNAVAEARFQKDPAMEPGHSFGSITDAISDAIFVHKTPLGWYAGFGVATMLMGILGVALFGVLYWGIGMWGENQPVSWAFDITNFVWWIGIGHAGTLISAILLLFKQQWRTSINRFAEAMTLFAVASAAIFPGIHVGRPWFAYWMVPYPNTMWLWPQFRSPLDWDVFAVSTYGTVSFLFWFVGLIPDFATLRDRVTNPLLQKLYGFLCFGWRGSARHWHRYETAYLLLAGLSTPLVLSVHTVVSFDFATSLEPGWHTTYFPPYFVAGAIYSGFAMVLTLAIPTRKGFKLHDFITMYHIENMAKVMLATGLIVAYAYVMEVFYAWYSGNIYEWFMIKNRMMGPYATSYYMLIFCNIITPQFLWFKRIRQNVAILFVISIIVNIGMWLERFVIIVVSLHRDYLPSSWDMFFPTKWDIMLYIGTIGLFLFLMHLFIRFMPMLPMFELRTLLPESQVHHVGHGHHGHIQEERA